MTIKERFDQFEKELLKFDRIEHKLNTRPDLHAFLLLDSMFSDDSDMVASATHDQIWLAVGGDAFESVVTDEQIRDLARCGIFWDDEVDSLSLFV